MKLTAITETYLKRVAVQAIDLSEKDKVAVPPGKHYFSEIEENENEDDGRSHGHLKIELTHNAGTWFIWPEHWELESQIVIKEPQPQPEWDEVDWGDWAAPVSKYFTVGEVTNMSRERIPQMDDIKQNIIAIARKMDDIREWWDGPLGVTSWYRPWHVNTRIGSRAPNHPGGYAVDFRPLNGSVWELQKRFQDEWYNAGKWSGGFGLGAQKGFVHLDLRSKRAWTY